MFPHNEIVHVFDCLSSAVPDPGLCCWLYCADLSLCPAVSGCSSRSDVLHKIL